MFVEGRADISVELIGAGLIFVEGRADISGG